MPGFTSTYCIRCNNETVHDIYISEGGYLHSLCTNCGKDSSSGSEVGNISGEASKQCLKCGRTTEHLRYVSTGGYIHWFCCSCGHDISSSAKGR